MTNDEHNSQNGKERRSGNDRRKGERRAEDNTEDAGVLSTRKSERRQQSRRAVDREPEDEPNQ